MFIKITRSGSRQYVQLVEAYRDDAGKAKRRTIATLGRLDQMTGSLDSVIAGLLKATGRSPDMLVRLRRRQSSSSRPARWATRGR